MEEVMPEQKDGRNRGRKGGDGDGRGTQWFSSENHDSQTDGSTS